MIFMKGSPVTPCIGAKAVGRAIGRFCFDKIENESVDSTDVEKAAFSLPNPAYGESVPEFQSYPRRQELFWKRVSLASFAKAKTMESLGLASNSIIFYQAHFPSEG